MFALTLLLLAPLHMQTPRVEPPRPPIERYSLEEILAAVQFTESGRRPDGGRHAVGDGGRAIGPFQIHRPYWIDTQLAGKFEDCRDIKYARRVVVTYWRRWCPEAIERLDAEVLARVHNGGPTGATKESTLIYWAKVERELERARYARASAPRTTAAAATAPKATAPN